LVLAIDIGNSRIKLAYYQKKKFVKKIFFYSRKELLDHLKTLKALNGAIVSSVAETDEPIVDYLSKRTKTIDFDHNTSIPIVNKYHSPATLGKDRLAASVGAYYEKKKTNNLIIDAGSCITYDLLTAEGYFLGGNISPGLKMRYLAMNEFTENLPLVEAPDRIIRLGKDTESAIQAGGFFGLLLEIEGMINYFNLEYSKLNILLTGGDANYLAKRLKTKIFVRPNLVLDGLSQIYNYNE
jgi:type III pantothenate kinase